MRIPSTLLAAVLAATVVAQAYGQRFPPTPPPAEGRTSVPVRSLPGAGLLAELRKGGYVIYFRHTATDMSRDDRQSRGDNDCDNQRPLTDRGREEARQIGAAFRELEIPVGRVLASPRCRTMETALLAFGRADRESSVLGGSAAPSNPDRYAGLRELLSAQPGGARNLVIASHGNPFYAVAGAPYLAEGEAAVVRPLGNDFEVVARVKHDGWRALARSN
jgi:phosphohistidine phosphatase SixA